MKIKAAVVEAKGEPFVIQELELTGPEANEVLVRVEATGVCHTDAGAQMMSFPTQYPIVLGHEASGVVEKVGLGVTHIKEGDRVILSYCYCGHCRCCLEANPGGCSENGRLNFGGRMEDNTFRLFRDGKPVFSFFGQASFATHAVANQKNVIVVNDKDVDLGLLGPLGCGLLTGAATVLHGIKPEFGSSIAVFGCGAVGLSAVMGAALSPCSSVIAVDVVDSKLELAKQLGATHVINGAKENVKERLLEITGGGTTYAVEASGVGPVFKQALNGLASAGKLVVVAVGHKEVTLDVPGEILFPTRTVQGMIEGSVMPQAFVPKLIQFYKMGRFPFDKLITYFPFEKINEAFAASKDGTAIKPVLKMS